MGRASNESPFARIAGRAASGRYPSPAGIKALGLLDEGHLEGACRLVVREGLRDRAILPALCLALAREGLEGRWGPRARLMLGMCGALCESSPRLLADRDGHLLHITPHSMEALRAHELPGPEERTFCGLDPSLASEEANMARVRRGAWMDPDEISPDADWRHCPECALRASETPDCQERADYAVFSRPEMLSARRTLADVLEGDISRTPAHATVGHARSSAQGMDTVVVHACARAAASGGRLVWERALGVSDSVTWDGRGLTSWRVDERLGKRFSPERFLTVEDWEEALGCVPLAQMRGLRSPKQTATFRRALWQRTLERKMGASYQYDGTVF
jgi:hypothetical protein